VSKFDDLIKEKIELIDRSPERFHTRVEAAQSALWRAIESDFAKLETKDGKVVQSRKNLATINRIISTMQTVMSAGEYAEAVKSFLADFDQAAKLTNSIAATIDKGVQPNEFSKELQQFYRESAIRQLFSNPINDTAEALRSDMISAIAAGASLDDAIKSARLVIEGSPDTNGRMLANVKTVASTALSVSDAGYSAAINAQAGFEWYRYTGGAIDTTRPFCEVRNGKYFHKKEIQAWGRGDNAGGVGGIGKDGTWAGQIEGTTESTIFAFRGGWNCRHQLIPVSISRVPQDVIKRNEMNGNYKP